jgi:hypothetical protein
MFSLGLNLALGAVKDFVEEPRPVSGFVDPVLDQARGGYIVVLIAHVVVGHRRVELTIIDTRERSGSDTILECN